MSGVITVSQRWVDGTLEELRTYFSPCNSLVQATTFGNSSREGGRRCQGPPTVILYSVVHNHHGIFLRSSSANKKARAVLHSSNHQSPQQQYLCFIIPASAMPAQSVPSRVPTSTFNFLTGYCLIDTIQAFGKTKRGRATTLS